MASRQKNARGLVRQLGEEFRNLQEFLSEVHADAPPGAGAEAAQWMVTDRWKSWVSAFARNRPQIHDLLARLQADVEADESVRDNYGLEITQLDNLWENLQAGLTPHDAAVAPPAAGIISAEVKRLNRALLTIGYITVPSRLNQHLDNYRPGQVLDFNREFADELPTEELRREMLDYLYGQPEAINGIVDPDQGTVTRVSEKGWRRAISIVGALLLAAVVVAICALLGERAAPLLAEGVDGGDLAKAAVFVLLGMLGHILVGVLKDLRRAATDRRRRFASIGNWVLWAHAHEVDVVAAIIIAGVLAYAIGGIQGQQDVLALLAVGYAGDSFVEILLPKFEKGVQERTEKVKKLVAA